MEKPPYVVIAGIAIWASTLLTGFKCIADYKTTPGAVGLSMPHWPDTSALVAATDRHTILMFLHPKCACSRGSVSELREVMHAVRDLAHAVVVVVAPDSEDAALIADALGIPSTTVAIDKDGAEARLFGAATSGHVMIYDRENALVMSGGITASRGHVGDNAGRHAAIAVVRGEGVPVPIGHVFGCALFEAHDE